MLVKQKRQDGGSAGWAFKDKRGHGPIEDFVPIDLGLEINWLIVFFEHKINFCYSLGRQSKEKGRPRSLVAIGPNSSRVKMDKLFNNGQA